MNKQLLPAPALPEEQNLVDLLEIYHARQLRDYIARHASRLERQRDLQSAVDRARTRELAGFYEALRTNLDRLLEVLGDND